MSNNKQFAKDFGKFSLWTNDSGHGSSVASGVFNTVDDNGEVTGTYKVYLHENVNKKNDNSPDFFGYAKFIEVKEDEEAPAKKVRKLSKKDDTDESGTWF